MVNRWPKPYRHAVTVMGPSSGPVQSVADMARMVCEDLDVTFARCSVSSSLTPAERAVLSQSGVILTCGCLSPTPTPDELADCILTGRELQRGSPWDAPLALVWAAAGEASMGLTVRPYHPRFGVVTFDVKRRQPSEDDLRQTVLHALSRRSLDSVAQHRQWSNDRHADGERSLDETFSVRRSGRLIPLSAEDWLRWGDGKLFT